MADDQQPITRDAIERGPYTARYHVAGAASPYVVSRFGRIDNPDYVQQLLRRGGWASLAYIRQIFLDEAIVGGIYDQFVAMVNAVDVAFKPGDASSEISRQMARDATRVWKDIPDTPMILAKQLYSGAYGYYPIDKVFGQHAGTGLLAATELYDVPPWYVDFDATDRMIWAPYGAAGNLGEPIPAGKMMVARWGSNATPRGESMVVPIFPNVWRMRTVRKLGLQALEILNRPIPWVKYPSGWDDDQVDDLEHQMIAKYKFAILTPSDEVREAEVDFPMNSVVASGTAARSELDVMADEVRTLYIKFLGATQSQKDTGGAYAKEVVKREIAQDKTPPAVQQRDSWIQHGWLDDLGNLNWANQPRQLWPRCESDAGDAVDAGLDGKQAEQLWLILGHLALRQITATSAEESLVLLGVPRPRALLMVQSTVDERGELQVTSQSVAAGSGNNASERA